MRLLNEAPGLQGKRKGTEIAFVSLTRPSEWSTLRGRCAEAQTYWAASKKCGDQARSEKLLKVLYFLLPPTLGSPATM